MEKNIPIDKIKANAIEGIRVGLFAFVSCFVFSFLLSILLNFTVMGFLKEAFLGAMGDTGATAFGTIVKTTALIMSLSVFNSLSAIKIGLLFFAIIPFVAFYFAQNKDKRSEGFTAWHLLTYAIASLIFSAILNILAMITRGELLGVQITFVSLKNILMTLVVTLVIQMMIGLNYNKNVRSYIKATRMLLRMLFGVGTVIGLIGLIKLMITIPVSIFIKMVAIVVILPNFAVYKSLMLMGNNIETSDSVTTMLEKVTTLQISFSALSMGMSIVAILLWIALVIVALLFVNKEKYWLEMSLFAFTFSVISMFLAFCTSTSLGEVILVGDISIGISLVQAFFVPLLSIGALGALVWMVRKMISIVKEI